MLFSLAEMNSSQYNSVRIPTGRMVFEYAVASISNVKNLTTHQAMCQAFEKYIHSFSHKILTCVLYTGILIPIVQMKSRETQLFLVKIRCLSNLW